MSVLDSINSLSDDIKTMQMLLDKHGIGYKNDIGYPLDDVATISNYIDDFAIDLSWKDDAIEGLENELYKLENEVDSLKRELENIER